MSWIGNLFRYRDERDRLAELKFDLEDHDAQYKRESKGHKVKSDEYQRALSFYLHQIDGTLAEIAEIETAQMIRWANFWRVPVPSPPYGTQDDSEMWRWHSVHGRHYLTDEGISALRREAYREWEMWSKPWLSYAALGISIGSFALALAAFLRS